MATIQGIYLALFGRPADPIGLTFFNNATNNGADLAAIGDLSSTPEYQNRFVGQTPVQIINSIYISLFGRPAELEGLTFFANALANGTFTINNIAIAILDGAQGSDLVTVNNKIAAANAFTAAIDTPEELVGYQGEAAAASGRAFISTVTDTVPDQAAVDAALAAAVEAGGNGGVITLTELADVVSANVFNAPRGFTPGGTDQVNTLNDDDVLTGTGTNPTLNLTFVNDADTGDDSIAPTLNGIETVNVQVRLDGDGLLDLQDATGVRSINIAGVDDGDFTVDNIQDAGGALGINLSVNDSNADDSGISFLFDGDAVEGSADVANLTLNDADVFGITVNDENAEPGLGFETVNLTSIGGTNEVGTLSIEDAEELIIDGDTALTLGSETQTVRPGTAQTESIRYGAGLGAVAGSLLTVDASALTASLDIAIGDEAIADLDDTSGTEVDFTVIGTAQNDTIRLLAGLDSDADSINGGGGDDVLQVFASVTDGTIAGLETLDIRGGQDTGTGADLIEVDTSIFTGLNEIIIRNEGQDDFGFLPFTSQPEDLRTELTELSAALAQNITVQHSSTGSNGIMQNVIEAELAVATGTSDLVALEITDKADTENRGVNIDPRFNVTLETVAVESITLTDSDSESNSVAIGVGTDVTDITGTVTVTGGQAGDFFNLDTAGNLYGLAQDGSEVDLLDTEGSDVSTVDADASVQDVDAGAAQRLSAAVINASGALSDVIVRVSDAANAAGVFTATGAQTITMGAGDDTVIFDRLGSTTAGLSISDTVAGGEGDDTIAIDGNGVVVTLGASEWTNVTGFETIRLIGNEAGGIAAGDYGDNAYNVRLTNDLIEQNGVVSGDGFQIVIVNDNDQENGDAGDLDDGLTGNESGVTIDARSLSADNSFTYDGEEGASRTADRFIMADANINGRAIIDGGAVNVAGDLDGVPTGNEDVLEIRNSAIVTVGDIAQLSNIGTLEFTNDTAAVQESLLQLDTATIDRLVNSLHTASVLEPETLFINVEGNTLVPGAATNLTIEAAGVNGTTTNFVVTSTGGTTNVTVNNAPAGVATTFNGGAGDDTFTAGAGNDTLNGGAGNDTLNGGAGNDTIIGGAGADTITTGTGDDTIVYNDATEGVDQITDFSLGGTDDQFQLDISGFGLDGVLNYQEGTAAGIAADGDVLVLTDGFATVALAAAAIAANANIVSTDGFFVFFNTTDNEAQLVYSTDLAADGAETVLADLTNVLAVGQMPAFDAQDFIFVA